MTNSSVRPPTWPNIMAWIFSSVVRAVFKQMVNTGRIPLTFAPEEPNGESLNAAAEADSFMASGKTGRFTNGHDLLEAAMR